MPEGKGNKVNVKLKEEVAVAGVDVGSRCTKTVIIDFNRDIIGYSIIRSGASHEQAAGECMDIALKKAGLKLDDE